MYGASHQRQCSPRPACPGWIHHEDTRHCTEVSAEDLVRVFRRPVGPWNRPSAVREAGINLGGQFGGTRDPRGEL